MQHFRFCSLRCCNFQVPLRCLAPWVEISGHILSVLMLNFRFTCEQVIFHLGYSQSLSFPRSCSPQKLRSRSCRRVSKHPGSCESLHCQLLFLFPFSHYSIFFPLFPAAAGNAQFCTELHLSHKHSSPARLWMFTFNLKPLLYEFAFWKKILFYNLDLKKKKEYSKYH